MQPSAADTHIKCSNVNGPLRNLLTQDCLKVGSPRLTGARVASRFGYIITVSTCVDIGDWDFKTLPGLCRLWQRRR